MANPKKRKTHSATHKGRAHLSLKKITLNKCPQCTSAVKPHTACSVCGTYKSKTIIKTKLKTVKKKK